MSLTMSETVRDQMFCLSIQNTKNKRQTTVLAPTRLATLHNVARQIVAIAGPSPSLDDSLRQIEFTPPTKLHVALPEIFSGRHIKQDNSQDIPSLLKFPQ